jgi:lipopolysaccharide transport system permease protein
LLEAVEQIPYNIDAQADPVQEFVIAPPRGTVRIDWAELWRYRDLFLVLAWRDISVRYKQTVLGVLWAVLQPLMNMVLYTVIMHRVIGISTGDGKTPYPIFVYVGLLFWQYYSSTLSTASNSMVTNVGIIQKVYFPRLIVPATAATTGLVDMTISGTILGCMMVAYRSPVNVLGLVALPVLVLITVLSALGLGMFLAAVNIKYREVRYALPFFITSLMYITPVIYPPRLLQKYPLVEAIVMWLNPISGVITNARAILIGNGVFDARLLAISAVMSCLLFYFGLYYFRSTERYFADIA